MQTIWNINNSDKLIIFFSGWGMDERATDHLACSGWDICTCFDYRDMTAEDIDSWRCYDAVLLVAWSMGVWAAEALASRERLFIDAAIAVNGTPAHVDDRCGIPSKTAWGTHDNLTGESLEKFRRRMFGDSKTHRDMKHRLSDRSVGELKEELHSIISSKPMRGNINWDLAVISGRDSIFPPENMKNYWTGRCRVAEIDAPHYPFHLFESWEDLLRG